jgi:penicillin-binding protein 1A
MDRISLYVQNPIAGKTGTTQNQSGWLVYGNGSNLVHGVWVVKIVQHDLNHYYGQGATAVSLPILGWFYETLLCSGLEASFQSKF